MIDEFNNNFDTIFRKAKQKRFCKKLIAFTNLSILNIVEKIIFSNIFFSSTSV